MKKLMLFFAALTFLVGTAFAQNGAFAPYVDGAVSVSAANAESLTSTSNPNFKVGAGIESSTKYLLLDANAQFNSGNLSGFQGLVSNTGGYTGRVEGSAYYKFFGKVLVGGDVCLVAEKDFKRRVAVREGGELGPELIHCVVERLDRRGEGLKVIGRELRGRPGRTAHPSGRGEPRRVVHREVELSIVVEREDTVRPLADFFQHLFRRCLIGEHRVHAVRFPVRRGVPKELVHGLERGDVYVYIPRAYRCVEPEAVERVRQQVEDGRRWVVAGVANEDERAVLDRDIPGQVPNMVDSDATQCGR